MSEPKLGLSEIQKLWKILMLEDILLKAQQEIYIRHAWKSIDQERYIREASKAALDKLFTGQNESER